MTQSVAVKQTLERPKVLESIAQRVPHGVDHQRLVKVAIDSCNKNYLLQKCSDDSIIGCVLECAQLGLMPGLLGSAYLVPFKGKNGYQAQLIVGYRGLIELANRSGKIKRIEARVVYEKDHFDWELGITPRIDHKPPKFGGDRGPMVGVYAFAIMHNDEILLEVMSREDVDKIRARSKAKDNGPWVTDYEEMAKKTVVRRLSKYLPLSPEFFDAVQTSDEREFEGHVREINPEPGKPRSEVLAEQIPDDPDTSQGEEHLPPEDWTEQQSKVLDFAENLGWDFDQTMKWVNKQGPALADCDSDQCDELLEKLTYEGEAG